MFWDSHLKEFHTNLLSFWAILSPVYIYIVCRCGALLSISGFQLYFGTNPYPLESFWEDACSVFFFFLVNYVCELLSWIEYTSVESLCNHLGKPSSLSVDACSCECFTLVFPKFDVVWNHLQSTVTFMYSELDIIKGINGLVFVSCYKQTVHWLSAFLTDLDTTLVYSTGADEVSSSATALETVAVHRTDWGKDMKFGTLIKIVSTLSIESLGSLTQALKCHQQLKFTLMFMLITFEQ